MRKKLQLYSRTEKLGEGAEGEGWEFTQLKKEGSI